MFALLLLERMFLFAQLIDDTQLTTNEASHDRFLNVITAMNGFKEMSKKGIEVSLVECFHGIVVLLVGLTLNQGIMNEVTVIIVAGKLLDFSAHENLITPDGLLQTDAF